MRHSLNHSVIFLFTILITIFFTISSQAKVLQEGWYKVYIGSSHMGYFVQRYDFDEKSKNFTSTYFFKTNALGGNITESLKATSNQKLSPIAYQFTNKTGETSKTIDIKFKKDMMEGTISTDGKIAKVQKKIEKGTFLSTFLIYLALQNQNGIKKGNNFSYNAVAEEDGVVYKGSLNIQSEEAFMGQAVFKALNNYKDTQWVNFITPDGVALTTKSPVQGIRTELASRPDATATFPQNEKILNSVFTTIPSDAFYKKIAASIPKPESKDQPKVVPPDQGFEKVDKIPTTFTKPPGGSIPTPDPKESQ